MNHNSMTDKIMHILLAIGGLNWGLLALFDFNLVEALFGQNSPISDLVYILVGVSGLYVLFRVLTETDRSERTVKNVNP